VLLDAYVASRSHSSACSSVKLRDCGSVPGTGALLTINLCRGQEHIDKNCTTQRSEATRAHKDKRPGNQSVDGRPGSNRRMLARSRVTRQRAFVSALASDGLDPADHGIAGKCKQGATASPTENALRLLAPTPIEDHSLWARQASTRHSRHSLGISINDSRLRMLVTPSKRTNGCE